jgi:subtilisin-like proprotein convertase family protein
MLLCRTVDEIAPSLDVLLNRLLAGYYLGTKWPEKGRGPWKVKVELRDQGDARVLHPVQLERPKK